MCKAVAPTLHWSGTAGIWLVFAILVSHVGLPSLAAQDGARPAEYFHPGLCFSRTHPLKAKQKAALLEELRRLTGFSELQADDWGFVGLGNRINLAGGSATARALIAAVVDGNDSFEIESHDRSSQVAFASIQPTLDYVSFKTASAARRRLWVIQVDFHDYGQLRGEAEAIHAFDPALTLLHELAHAVMGLTDLTSKEDALGDCERHINRIRRELGLAERQHYESANTQVLTPYSTSRRVIGEIGFARIDEGKRIKRSRLTFDVENVSAACLPKDR